ncbi:MAG: hypothetical protein KGS10_14505 [Chloroflexi bacterium]|nr:hypothetical protein [Chloroflexota bacterium]
MRVYSTSATGAHVVVAAPARPRSPIGRWTKTSVDVDVDPGTLALAAHLTQRYGGLAVTIATGIRTRLVAFMSRDRDNDDGNVRRYDPQVLETLTAWPGKPGTLLAVLESAGITNDGRIRHWHDLVGNPSPTDRRRMVDRDRQRRHRARTAKSVTPDTVTKRDSSVTGTVTAAPTYKERPPARAQGVEVDTHTQTALRATTKPASEHPAVAILVGVWPGAVPASVARRITHEVRDIERWRRTVATWQSAGWHVGAGAIGAMLDRYRQDADGKRAKLALSGRTPGVRADKPALPAAAAPVVATHSPGTPPPTAVPPLPKPATPESRAAFARAFAGSPFRLSQGTRAWRSQTDPRTPTTTKPVPDLRSLPPDQRAAVALAALRTIGHVVSPATAVQ